MLLHRCSLCSLLRFTELQHTWFGRLTASLWVVEQVAGSAKMLQVKFRDMDNARKRCPWGMEAKTKRRTNRSPGAYQYHTQAFLRLSLDRPHLVLDIRSIRNQFHYTPGRMCITNTHRKYSHPSRCIYQDSWN